MSLEATQRVEVLLGDGGQLLPDKLPHLSDLAGGDELPDDTGHRLRLAALRELLQVGEVDPLAAELDGVETPAAGGLALAAPQVYRGRVDDALSRRMHLCG